MPEWASSLVSAVVGGLLSYVGLFITFKHQDKKQNELDLQNKASQQAREDKEDRRLLNQFRSQRTFYVETHMIQVMEDGIEVASQMRKIANHLASPEISDVEREAYVYDLILQNNRLRLMVIGSTSDNGKKNGVIHRCD